MDRVEAVNRLGTGTLYGGTYHEDVLLCPKKVVLRRLHRGEISEALAVGTFYHALLAAYHGNELSSPPIQDAEAMAWLHASTDDTAAVTAKDLAQKYMALVTPREWGRVVGVEEALGNQYGRLDLATYRERGDIQRLITQWGHTSFTEGFYLNDHKTATKLDERRIREDSNDPAVFLYSYLYERKLKKVHGPDAKLAGFDLIYALKGKDFDVVVEPVRLPDNWREIARQTVVHVAKRWAQFPGHANITACKVGWFGRGCDFQQFCDRENATTEALLQASLIEVK